MLHLIGIVLFSGNRREYNQKTKMVLTIPACFILAEQFTPQQKP